LFSKRQGTFDILPKAFNTIHSTTTKNPSKLNTKLKFYIHVTLKYAKFRNLCPFLEEIAHFYDPPITLAKTTEWIVLNAFGNMSKVPSVFY
jgi:hypothetical protein